ncbi:MAG: permease-like cell division protein FtsX [Clostridiales bacterium]|nr:permease-like cell division protein FtsX [Clostridiales bacterium]
MKLKSFRYVIPQAFKSLRLNGWMTFAAIMTVTISLFLCSIFWLMIMNIDANARDFESDVRVLAYIDDRVQEEVYPAIEQRISRIEGVAGIEFVDRDEGLETLNKRFGLDLKPTLGGSNPLPNMYSITAASTDDVEAVARAVAQIPQIGADNVKYGRESVQRLFALTNTMRKVGLAIMTLLGIAAVVLVAMTIRLTVLARKKEIMVMKWVGATNAFIRWPFFLEGVILGLTGAALAAGLVLFCYQNAGQWLSSTISFVMVLSVQEIWFNTALFTLSAGVLMGIFGSLISLARFLEV